MAKTIHALIVGINAYPTQPLFGCVNDALAIGQFFKKFCDNPANNHSWNPRYLLAPHPSEAAAIEQAAQVDAAIAESQLPLRANLIAAFDHFNDVQPDDVCMIYYSGHGALEPAAPEFAAIEPDGMNETFVCLDSRTEGSRDLLDKEFAWLISRVKNRIPEGHLLVITDSCHAGGATKSSESTTRDRRASATDVPTPFETLLGVANVPESERILTLENNRASYKAEARHIQLAASRDSETAKETYLQGQQHGIFTWNLLRVLGSGGTGLSYRELMRRTEVLVRNMVNNQIPQINTFAGAKHSETFLGGALASAAIEYPIVFRNNQWQLQAGALHGIVLDPGKTSPTIVQLTDNRKVKVEAVYSNYSLLDRTAFSAAETAKIVSDQRATILEMPNAKISVYVGVDVLKPELQAALQVAIIGLHPQYVDFTADSEVAADYAVAADEADQYMLIKKGSDYPVFKRQINAYDFVSYSNSVGKWRFVQEMGKSSMNGFTLDDLEIKLEVLSDISPETINEATGEIVSEDNVVLTYTPPSAQVAQKVPGLRCSVVMKKSGFWVGGLYLDSEFGIFAYLKAQQVHNDAPRLFEFQEKKEDWEPTPQTYNAIPVLMHPIQLQQGVREITEYLKIYVSNQDFSVSDFEQEPLPLDDTKSKGNGFGKTFAFTPDWMVITIPVTIRAASATVDLQSLSGAGFKVSELPEGFTAQAALVSTNEIRSKLSEWQSRGFEIEPEEMQLPPAGLWGESTEASVVFSNAFDGQQSQSGSVIELTEVKGKLTKSFFLNLEDSCAEDEVIVAYGYDADAGGFFPVGLSNGNKQVEVFALPSETPGRIQQDQEDMIGKGVGDSVKMFFTKLIRKQNPNTLVMVNKDMSRVSDLGTIQAAVANARHILMVTPGFLGDTDKIVDAIMLKTNIHESYEVVFAYDFENLNTPLETTAADLYERLKAAGVFDPAKGRRLTVLGSSMGGIMVRWMVEKNPNATPFIEHLFLVAAPNLGTDMSTFRKRLFALIGKALSGVAALKPYLIPLSIVAKKAEKELWVTLQQMNPEDGKSPYLNSLNETKVLPSEIKRGMIGGTVKDLSLNNHNKGKFFKRLKRFVLKTFMDWFVFDDDHDLINPLSSQKGAPWMKPDEMVILPVDHLSYYFDEESLKALEKALVIQVVPATTVVPVEVVAEP